MTYFEKTQSAEAEARTGKYIFTDADDRQYKYGENPFADMHICNCCFVDMFPEEVKDKTDFYGFNRSKYILEQFNY